MDFASYSDIDAWLANTADGLDADIAAESNLLIDGNCTKSQPLEPALLSLPQHPQSISLSSLSLSLSESQESGSRKRKRRVTREGVESGLTSRNIWKRRKTMNNSESASDVSNVSARTLSTSITSLQNRPILRPSPPSSRQRSPSPTRVLLKRLKNAVPPLLVQQPDTRIGQPAAVRRLVARLVRRLSKDVIPSEFEERLRAEDCYEVDACSHLFRRPSTTSSSAAQPSTSSPQYLHELWQRADTIYEKARLCNDANQDESAWVDIVRRVLDAAGLEEKSSKLSVYSIQTQTINPELLPKHTLQSFQKKADIALGFSPNHPDIAPALQSFTQSNPDVAISQMLDTFADEVPLACGIEVKRNGGDSCEASAQLGLWCAAGLERLRTLCMNSNADGSQQEDLPPMVGWTVVGHEWKLCISWKDRDGSVTVMGPWRLLNASTQSHWDILVLIALIQDVKSWLEEEYWGWLSRNIFSRP